jgi:transcription initiation factor TFIID subunit 7
VAYPVTLLDLPAVVESYKTLDDTNLVKITDVGQVGGFVPVNKPVAVGEG